MGYFNSVRVSVEHCVSRVWGEHYVKNNTSTNEHCSDVSDPSHDVLLPSTIFFTAARQALCEGSPVCKADAPLPCSGDIASVLSQWPNEYLDKNKSATSFCS